MSQPPPLASSPGTGASPVRWKVAGWSAAAMVVLALIGVGLASADRVSARNYWIGLVPVYGVLCTVTAWKNERVGEHLVLRQALHWLAIAGAVALDFATRGTGVDSQLASGLSALMLLALGCVLAGVHLDWLFAPVGLLLACTWVLVAKADQYLWLVLVVAALSVPAWIALRRMRAAPVN